MADTTYSFFGVETFESRDYSTISSITTKVRGVNVHIPKEPCKHDISSTRPSLSLILALSLVLACNPERHKLVAMQSPLCATSLSIEIISGLARL